MRVLLEQNFLGKSTRILTPKKWDIPSAPSEHPKTEN